MFLIFHITEAFGTSNQKIKIERSFQSKEEIQKKFLQQHTAGQTISEAHKLTAYGSTIVGSEVLAVNRDSGACHSIEIIHSDKINEI